MLLANGALNVLAKIVSSTREDENGDNNMQLKHCRSCLISSKLAMEVQSRRRGCSSRYKRVGFYDTEKLLGLLHIIADNHSQLLSRQEISLCKVIKQISGVWGADAVSRLQNQNRIDGLRSLLEILERVDQANSQGHLKVIASSCLLSLLVHSQSNAMYKQV